MARALVLLWEHEQQLVSIPLRIIHSKGETERTKGTHGLFPITLFLQYTHLLHWTTADWRRGKPQDTKNGVPRTWKKTPRVGKKCSPHHIPFELTINSRAGMEIAQEKGRVIQQSEYQPHIQTTSHALYVSHEAKNWTWGFAHTKQVLYNWATPKALGLTRL